MSYDSAGNNTADTVNSYTYDAENRIVTATVSGTVYCYTYDADGVRTMKSQGSSSSCGTVDILYWRNIAGNTIAETDSSGSTSNSSYHEYVFFAGRRIARADWGSSSFTVYYYFVDHLGSTRSMTSAAGTVCFKADYLPYGAENTPSGFTDSCNTTYKFTGYERDGETGLDYAFARYYNQRLARFMSGDPVPGDPSDPQSLNRYAYVHNNPINRIDPTGMIDRNNCITSSCSIYASGMCMGVVRGLQWQANIDSANCENDGGWWSDGSDTDFFGLIGGDQGGGGGASVPSPTAKPQTQTTSTCVVAGHVTGVGPGQATGKGAFGFIPPVGSVAIDPEAIGLLPGQQTNNLLAQYASQITFSFTPTRNVGSGFPTSYALGDILDPKARVGGVYFRGVYGFDIYRFPTNAAANAATGNVQVTITYPSSLPLNCGGPIGDPILPDPGIS